MKFVLAALVAALAFAAPVQAAPDPADVDNPEHQYVLTRILPNGRETTLAVLTEDGTFTSEQLIRSTAFAASRQNRTNNPSWTLVLYGPTNGGPHTDDDRIWDSRVQP